MESDGGGERRRKVSEREREVSGITWGYFWNISKQLKCFFRKIFVSDSLKTILRARLAVIFKSVSTLKNTFKCFWDENKVFGKF